MEENGQLHAPAALLPGKEPPESIGGPQGRSGRGGEEKVDDPVGNRTTIRKLEASSLYWLSCYGNA
jgi:hypothetical protein